MSNVRVLSLPKPTRFGEESEPLLKCEGTTSSGALFVRAAKPGYRACVRFRKESSIDQLAHLKDIAGRSSIKFDDMSAQFVSDVLKADGWNVHPNRSFTFKICEGFGKLISSRTNFIHLAPHLEEIILWKE